MALGRLPPPSPLALFDFFFVGFLFGPLFPPRHLLHGFLHRFLLDGFVDPHTEQVHPSSEVEAAGEGLAWATSGTGEPPTEPRNNPPGT